MVSVQYLSNNVCSGVGKIDIDVRDMFMSNGGITSYVRADGVKILTNAPVIVLTTEEEKSHE